MYMDKSRLLVVITKLVVTSSITDWLISELPKSGTLNGKYNFNKLQKVLELHTFLLAKHSKMCYNF